MGGRARTRWIIAGTVAAALVAVAATVLFIFRDRATPVERGDIQSSLVTGAGGPGDFGLYLYATTGFETTDALTGGRHDYPAQTLLTIQPGGCGTLVRWQALEERWVEHDYCPDGSLAGWQTFHRWFGVGNLDTWTCTPPLPSQGEPGEAWSGTCHRAAGGNVTEAEETLAFEALGYETLTLGGTSVETLHLRVTSTGSGGSESRDVTDTWVLPGTQLVVRQVALGSSTTESRIGAVAYHEEYEIQLVSLYPSS